MRKIYCIYIALSVLYLFSFLPAAAQQLFDHYQPIQSSGQLPADLLVLSSEKFEQEKTTISSQDKRFERKAKKEFMLESNFRIRDLLFKGKILFNDPVGIYVNKVVDQLLLQHPQLRKEIRVYVVKSPSVNAFATNNGMVFVNLGLIAQLQSESQLAFILSHELTHYTKKHVINQYVVDQKIDNNKSGYRSLSSEEKLLTSNNYSKELETEADAEGLKLFLNSNYSTKQIPGTFTVLQYSYLPFDDVSFEKSFFETNHLVLPDDYFLKNVKTISTSFKEDDTRSTHPSIEKRRKYVEEQTSALTEKTKKDYLVSESEFKNIRKIARYELSSLYLSSLEYEKAIYNSYLLLQEDKNNHYLQKNIAKALYGLAKYANEDAYTSVHEDYEEIEGSSQQVHHLFSKLSSKELNVMALKYIWDLKKRTPKDKELPVLAEDLLKSFVLKHCEAREEFYLAVNDIPANKEMQHATAENVQYNKLNKYEKAEFNAKKEKVKEDQHFIKTAFIDNFKDKDFSEGFEKYMKEKQLLNERNKETKKQKRERLRLENKQKAKQQKLERKKGAALGVDKIVLVNPFYYKVDQRKKKSLKLIASESAQINLDDKIKENARLADLNIELLSQNSFTATDVARFNDYAFLRGWINERIHHLEGSVPMVNLEGEYVEKLIGKYGTKYYCWTGIVDLREKKHDIGYTLFATTVFFPFLPLGIYHAVTPSYRTYYYTLVFNIETGKPEYAAIQNIDMKASPDVLNSVIYDTFYQIKNKR